MAEPQGMSVQGTGGTINSIKKYSDIVIAVAIITIVIMMIIPLPTALLDLLICVNITAALTIVISTIYN